MTYYSFFDSLITNPPYYLREIFMDKRRVVITGIGMLTPLGNTLKDSWSAAKEGKSGIDTITRFDASAFSARIAGEVKGFNIEDFVDRKEAKKLDLFSQFAIAASQEAWDDSGLTSESYDPKRFGCIVGVGMGGLGTLENNHTAYEKSGPRRVSPFLIPAMISNLAAGHIAIRYGLRGINYVACSACASATHAIGEAARLISLGVHDAVITGGTESTVTSMGIGGFAAMKALSTRNDDPTKASRPFDKGRDGFVLSEGSVILTLESLESAQARGAKIYAEVLGYGYSCDASHITAPSGIGAEDCMKDAIKDAGLTEKDITYVNAHGTSTPVGDVTETNAIKNVFKEYANNGLIVSSTKSMTGHMLGAAGAIEAAFCSLSIKEGIILPTINLDDPEESCDLDYVPNTARKTDVKYALSNSFGFGGTNASVVLGKV